jgi:hypothetical protein
MLSYRRLVMMFALVLFAAASGAWAATIEVVIPAKAPSRPAHFNWTFTSANGQPAQVGQFACGSYWVAPAEGDSGVTFVSLTGNPAWKDLLSCDTDPVTEKHGLLSGKNGYGSYDASENELPKLPQTYKPAADSCISLVAAMQRDEAATSKGGTKQIEGEVADAYCVVTVMPKAPRDAGKNMIRPNITGATKEFLTWDDFDLTRLPKHDFIQARTPEQWESVRMRWAHTTEVFGIASEVQTQRQGLQFTKFSEGGRAFRAHLLVPDYAAGSARVYYGDLLALFSPQNNLEEVKPALAAMLAYGLDIYHTRYNIGQTARKQWSCGAGQSLGQFMPAVLAAALEKKPEKANRLRMAAITNHGEDPGEVGPHEMRQTKRGMTGVLLWGDYHPIIRKDGKMVEADWRYWADFTGSKCYDAYAGDPANRNASRGKKTAADPYGYIDGPANQPGSSYMSVSFGGIQAFAAAMILMPEIRSIVNTDDPIEYTDRIIRHGLWTWPDPVAAPPKEEQDTARLWWSVQGAESFGKTWGVRPDDVRFAFEDGKGRFKSLHGKPVGPGYTTAAAAQNWDRIIALYDGPKFEDNVVELGVVVAPEILVLPGEATQVYLQCATFDAKIHYTLDGTDPTAASPVYEGKPITVPGKSQLRAMATVEGKKASAIRSKTIP